MKKFAALFMALMMLFTMAVMAEELIDSPDAGDIIDSPDAGDIVDSPDAEDVVDTFTSASVVNFYAQYALTGDDLMNAVNSQSGTYLIMTTNPDGTPNAGYFIFAIKKLNDQYYLQLGLAENQSKLNLEANGEGLAVYAANPTGDKAYAVSGARFYFKAIEDQTIVDELMKDARQGAMFFEITEVLPLG